jgi:hypothetical protein
MQKKSRFSVNVSVLFFRVINFYRKLFRFVLLYFLHKANCLYLLFQIFYFNTFS